MNGTYLDTQEGLMLYEGATREKRKIHTLRNIGDAVCKILRPCSPWPFTSGSRNSLQATTKVAQ